MQWFALVWKNGKLTDDFATNLIAGGVFFVLEVIAVACLLRWLENRRWRAARKAVAVEFQKAIKNLALVGEMHELDVRAKGHRNLPDDQRRERFMAALDGLQKKGDNIHQSLVAKAALYAPAMTAEQMATASETLGSVEQLCTSLTDWPDPSFFPSKDMLSARVDSVRNDIENALAKLEQLFSFSGVNTGARAIELEEPDHDGNLVVIERKISELIVKRAEEFASEWKTSFEWTYGFHLPEDIGYLMHGGMKRMTPEERELPEAPF